MNLWYGKSQQLGGWIGYSESHVTRGVSIIVKNLRIPLKEGNNCAKGKKLASVQDFEQCSHQSVWVRSADCSGPT